MPVGVQVLTKITPKKTGAIIADSTLYNPKKPNENFLNIDAIKLEFAIYFKLPKQL
jgi:hypothetical protein